jgi:hypothetical protein
MAGDDKQGEQQKPWQQERLAAAATAAWDSDYNGLFMRVVRPGRRLWEAPDSDGLQTNLYANSRQPGESSLG